MATLARHAPRPSLDSTTDHRAIITGESEEAIEMTGDRERDGATPPQSRPPNEESKLVVTTWHGRYSSQEEADADRDGPAPELTPARAKALSAAVREMVQLGDSSLEFDLSEERGDTDEQRKGYERREALRQELRTYDDREIYEESRRQMLDAFEAHDVRRVPYAPADNIRFWQPWRGQADRFNLVPPDVLEARELAYAAMMVLEEIEGQYLGVNDEQIVSQRHFTAAGRYERARVAAWISKALQGYEDALLPSPTDTELRIMVIRCTLYLLRERRIDFADLWDDDDSPVHAHASEPTLFQGLTAETSALLLSTWANEKGGNPGVVSKWEAVARAVAEISGQPKPEAAAVEQSWRRWLRRHPDQR
jgi:hypothetical protein